MFDFLDISHQMAQNSPVMIIGAARSGTSILARILQKHSSFKSKKVNLVETSVFAFPNKAHLFPMKKPNSSLFRFMLEDEKVYQEFLDSVKMIQQWHHFLANSGISKTLKNIPYFKNKIEHGWRSNMNHHLARNFFFFAQKARGCKRILEKSPNNIHYFNEVLMAFPQARMLYIYRHPVDVFTSYRKRQIEHPHEEWTKISLKDFYTKYDKDMRLLMNYQKAYPQHLLGIKYEVFTANPETEIQKICAFVGEAYEKEILLDQQDKNVDNWKVDPHLFKEIATQTKEWATYISEEELIEMQTYLREVMTAFGYADYLFDAKK